MAQTPAQLDALRRNPDQVRQRIQASGLTAAEVRDRLQAAGLPPTLLDPFLLPESGSDSALSALKHVLDSVPVDPATTGLPGEAQGLERVPVATGPQLQPAARTEAQAAGLQLFGLDVFRGRTTQFQPLLSGPVPPSYRVGPGDGLLLVLTGDVELAHELAVSREGSVVIPQVGQLSVGGITMEQLTLLLRDRLGQSYSGIRRGTTKFDLSLVRLRTNQVFVVGEVMQPGAYRLAAVATVLNALYAAGGLTERANFRQVFVRRAARTAAVLDVYDYLLRGDTGNDIVLAEGDVVFVPVHGTRASVEGAVIRPAIYELEPGETLSELIAMAGGYRAEASLKRISIARIEPPGERSAEGPSRVVIDVALEFDHHDGTDGVVPNGFTPPVPIEPGDEVTVFAVPDDERGFVELDGAVYHPGRYQWTAGMRLSDLIGLAGGFKPAWYSGRAHVVRLDPLDSTRYVVPVALPADSTGPYPEDPVLEEYDLVRIYSRDRFRESRTVSIDGMVNRPESYQFWNGMTLRDLVMLSGGLKDGAYLDSAEVARLPADRSDGRLALTLKVPLDSTYLLERDSSTYPRLPGLPGRARGAPEVSLEPFDHVTILKQPEFELQRTVTIAGEVRFPGTYALTRKDERVSDLVERAGGLLPTAYAGGARFLRAQGQAGRVNLDLQRILRSPEGPWDIALQPGDLLEVPEFMPTVRVEGAVNAPGSVLYREGAGLDYYVENAGGYARSADQGRVSVRYANGSAATVGGFLFFRSAPRPGPGSAVVVPAKPEREPLNITALLGNVAQIVAGTVAIVVIAVR